LSGIVWLASYPKSGNTWFRAFISNLLTNGDEPVDVNNLSAHGFAAARELFDDLTGIEASNLTPEEIDNLRPAVFDHLGSQSEETLFIKVHDAYTCLPDGRPLFSAAKAKAVYIVRNPLDVAVSFAHHSVRDPDTIISWMENKNFSFAGEPDRLDSQLRQKLLDWSGHVESWVDCPSIEVHVVRYEDMQTNPVGTFSQAARFAGLAGAEESVRRAVQFSDFRILQKQEEEKGFQEKPPGMASFFRQGKAGGWRDQLTAPQAERIKQVHGRVMRRFGYLD
jgi:hypothetical protein